MTTYDLADTATTDLAASIVADHHPDLVEADILILMRSPTAKSKGRDVLGKARKSTPVERALTGRDLAFTIELDAAWWWTAKASQRKALLDHELCHCVGDLDVDGMVWSLRGHDIEEFVAILERHGSWNEDIAEVKRALQLDLFREDVTRVPSFHRVDHDEVTGEVVEA